MDSVGKFLEKIIDTRLKKICEENDLLTNNQYGFGRGKSTVDATEQVL